MGSLAGCPLQLSFYPSLSPRFPSIQEYDRFLIYIERHGLCQQHRLTDWQGQQQEQRHRQLRGRPLFTTRPALAQCGFG